MRELIGKSSMKISYLPHKITVAKNETFDQKQIATEFNKFPASVWPKLARKIPELHNNLKNTFKKLCKFE